MPTYRPACLPASAFLRMGQSVVFPLEIWIFVVLLFLLLLSLAVWVKLEDAQNQLLHQRFEFFSGLFGHDPLCELPLLVVDGEHLLLDAAPDQDPLHVHLTILTDAVHSVHGLVLASRVPPRVDQHDAVGRREVESQAACLETDEEDADVRVVVERVDGCLPTILRHLAIQTHERHTSVLQPSLDDVQELGELTEDDALCGLAVVGLRQGHVDLSVDLLELGRCAVMRSRGGTAAAVRVAVVIVTIKQFGVF
mmetsp:Transcript_45666/g.113461  ORF Transcript_45666/g.113461 Transcript_45666/m.113461 type:complete len:252 (+) Transcript_45666:210-965(+)